MAPQEKNSKVSPKKEKSLKTKKSTNVEESKSSKLKATKVSSKKFKTSKVSKLALRNKNVKKSRKNVGDNESILKPRRNREPKVKWLSDRGVVYLGHIPHGFYEKEIKAFFSQFGQVTGVRIPRSTRTGKFKGYAYVEFMYPDVAKIVAETMNNYLMFKKVLKARCVPPEQQKPYAFKYPQFKVPLAVRRKRFLRKQSNRVLNEEENKVETKRVENLIKKKMKKLKKIGVDYEFQVERSENSNCETTS